MCLLDNRCKSRGVMELASLLTERKIPNVEVLALESNEIDEEFTHDLSFRITERRVPNLHEFCIGGNSIGDEMRFIFSAISRVTRSV